VPVLHLERPTEKHWRTCEVSNEAGLKWMHCEKLGLRLTTEVVSPGFVCVSIEHPELGDFATMLVRNDLEELRDEIDRMIVAFDA
jgi:hypothetical protein